jgi:nucleoside-diphosphate-sugar epimerase
MDILLTGANGFLGRVIKKELQNLYSIKTLGRKGCDFNCDLTLVESIQTIECFDLIIHCAGKAHISGRNRLNELLFFDVNLNGTINLLNSISKSNLPKYFVYISSVSVYGLNRGSLIDENSPLLAKDPYGKSKIMAEQFVAKWCKGNNIVCTILRLPLIIGENPKGNLKSMINGLKRGYYFNIAGGLSKRSMVLADDVANVIVPASKIGGIFNLTDGLNPSYFEMSVAIASYFKRSYIPNIPMSFATFFAKIGDFFGEKSIFNTDKFNKLTNSLTFNDTSARLVLGWKPNSVLSNLNFLKNE